VQIPKLWTLGLEFSPAKTPNLQAKPQLIHRFMHFSLQLQLQADLAPFGLETGL
jgi:hypothetical protein